MERPIALAAGCLPSRECSRLAAELLRWIERRTEPQGGGRVLPRTHWADLQQALGAIWRASLQEKLEGDARDGRRRLADLYDWDNPLHASILAHPNVEVESYAPPVGDDWSWRPESLEALVVALRLVAGDAHAAVSPEGGDAHAAVSPEGGDAAAGDEYAELREWAAKNLSVMEQRLMNCLLEHRGKAPLAEVLSACEWEDAKPFESRQASCNKKLRQRLRRGELTLWYRITRKRNVVHLISYEKPTKK